jgi:hypothetical protein
MCWGVLLYKVSFTCETVLQNSVARNAMMTRWPTLFLAVKPIYVTIRNLNSVVSGKAAAWRVLGMVPSLRKSATLAQSDVWRKDHRLRLHDACIAHVVDMVNKFGSEDKHLLCADGKV